MTATELLRPGLLQGSTIAVAGADPLGPHAVATAAALRELGAIVQEVAVDPHGDDEPVEAAFVSDAPLHALVWDAAGTFGGDPADPLRAALDGAWLATRAAVNARFIPGGAGGLVLYLAPPPGDERAAAARAGLENLARICSIEWARLAIRPVALLPGVATTPDQVAALVAYLASPAGAYYSGCRLEPRRGVSRRAWVVVASALILAGAFAIVLALVIEKATGPIPLPADSGPRYEPDRRALGAAVAISPLRTDGRYRDLFAAGYESLTPENAMKWNALQPRRGDFEFVQSDRLVDWAQALGKRVRGHPLVWDQQLPPWLTEEQWSAAELEQVLREHVRTIVRRYRGRIESWDVVNEPFEDDGTWTRNVFFNALGTRYVTIAFEAAQAADPDARLFLNELAGEREGPKQRALLRLAAGLRAAGLDGVGYQNHTNAASFPTRDELVDALQRVTALDLDVEITEMDVEVGGSDGPVARQPAAYRAAVRACLAVARCTGLTVWGVTDATSWLGADKRPLPFDADGRPKPEIVEALRELTAR